MISDYQLIQRVLTSNLAGKIESAAPYGSSKQVMKMQAARMLIYQGIVWAALSSMMLVISSHPRLILVNKVTLGLGLGMSLLGAKMLHASLPFIRSSSTIP